MTVHSVHCRLGPVPATLPTWSVFNRLSIQASVKPQKRNKARNMPDFPSASVNIIGRGCEPLRGRRGRRDTNCNPLLPDVRITVSVRDTTYNVDLTFLVVRLSRFQFQISFSNLLDFSGFSRTFSGLF